MAANGEKRGGKEGGTERGKEGGRDSNSINSKDQRRVEGQGRGNYSNGESISEIPEKSLVKPENVPIEILSENTNSNIEISETKQKRKYKKRESKSNSNSNSQIGQVEISSLICGTFNLISMKAGEHWALSPSEADSVASPLSNILKKMNLVEQVANVSDGMMLILALATITIPRIMISSEKNKSKKKNRIDVIKKEGELKVEQKSTSTTEIGNNNNRNGIEGTTVPLQYDKTIYATSPQ